MATGKEIYLISVHCCHICFRAFLKANAEEKEVVPPELDLTPQQLFWVGYGQDYCLLGGNFERYDNLGDLIERYSVILNNVNLFIFIINFQGGVHAASPWRVNTVLSNQKEFAQDFNCPKGAKLNPVKKCVVW